MLHAVEASTPPQATFFSHDRGTLGSTDQQGGGRPYRGSGGSSGVQFGGHGCGRAGG